MAETAKSGSHVRMTEPTNPMQPLSSWRVLGWVQTAGLVAVVAWTTLCLGGYLADTMVVSGPVVLGLGALAALEYSFRPYRLQAIWLLPVPFLFYSLGSVWWVAPAKWLAWREWLLWLQMWIIFGLVLHTVRTPGQRGLLVAVVAGLGLCGAGMAAYQHYVDRTWLMLGRHQLEQFQDRSAGMFGIPNSLAGMFELIVPACLVLAGSRSLRTTVRIFCLWCAGILVFALILTVSRGGWMALILTAFIWSWLRTERWRTRLVGFAVSVLILLGGVLLLYHSSKQVHDRFQPFLTGEFERTRPCMWRAAIDMWRTSPWMGTGAGSYKVLLDSHRPVGFNNDPLWAHNDYLNTLSDYGVLGCALWLCAGAGILLMAWKGIRADQGTGLRTAIHQSWRWRLGLWLGLVAFSLHLLVDFHTKIPALVYLAAISAGMLFPLVEAEARAIPKSGGRWRVVAGLLLIAFVALLLGRALPLYRGEAARFLMRREIDYFGEQNKGPDRTLIQDGLRQFGEAVQFDPDNAQAWSDLAYITALSWKYNGGGRAATGRKALAAADRAIALCPVAAEFWVRRGVALDMIPDTAAAELSFAKAIAMAPNTAEWRYYQAYRLAALPGRKEDTKRALGACLSLDANYTAAIDLRQRLQANPP